MSNILTTNFKYNSVKDVLSSNDSYYLFVGNFYEQNSVPEVEATTQSTYHTPWADMIMGKVCLPEDFSPVINTIAWQTDYKFSMYDDTDVSNDPEAVITSEGSFYHVWKCLHNNNANSTIKPLFTDITGPNTAMYQTSDGYIWKYLYSVENTTVDKFKIGTYYPVVANSTTTAIAQNELNIFVVENTGRGYNNYITSTFKSDDISINGNKTLFKLSTTDANTSNNFYNNCVFYITSGDSKGTIREITSYISNGSGNYFQVNTEILTLPMNGDGFEIYPQVIVTSDQTQTTNCVARAIINASGNSVYRVEALQEGIDYKYATANVYADPIVGVSNVASIRAILPPKGGHGANVYNELGCSGFVVSVSLANSESNTILTSNKFQQFGLLKNPLFANVSLVLQTVNNFDSNEQINKIELDYLSGYGSVNSDSTTLQVNKEGFTAGTIEVTANSTNVIGTSTHFLRDFVSDDYVVISSNSTNGRQILQINAITNNTFFTLKSNSTFTNAAAVVSPYHQRLPNLFGKVETDDYLLVATENFESCHLVQVNSVVNSTCVTLTANCDIDANNAYIYKANVISSVNIISSNSISVQVASCDNQMLQGSMLYGNTSHEINFINKVLRNDVAKQYDTFIQLYKYTATIINGEFIIGEKITQGDISGILHSVIGAGTVTMYFSGFENGVFAEGAILGTQSMATANVTSIEGPELLYGSGSIDYLENIEAVTRSNTETQTFKILVNF